MNRYNAIVLTGIKIVNRVEIPPDMVPDDAKVEITVSTNRFSAILLSRSPMVLVQLNSSCYLLFCCCCYINRPRYTTATTPEIATQALAKMISKRPKEGSMVTRRRMPRRKRPRTAALLIRRHEQPNARNVTGGGLTTNSTLQYVYLYCKIDRVVVVFSRESREGKQTVASVDKQTQSYAMSN